MIWIIPDIIYYKIKKANNDRALATSDLWILYFEILIKEKFKLDEGIYHEGDVISFEVSLLIDGKKIELNEFTKDFLGGTLQGAISPLKGIKSDWKQLDIKVKR